LPAGWLGGVTAAQGLAIGKVRWLRHVEREIPTYSDDPVKEVQRLNAALADLGQRLADRAQGEHGSVAQAHLALLEDPELRVATDRGLAQGHSADFAWRSAMRAQADVMRATGDRRLAERADDFLDLERQVLALLAGEEPEARLDLPEDTLLLAEDLLPSHVMALDLAKVRGFATMRGGPTSHVAILAGGMNLPALVALGDSLRTLEDGALVILDAGRGGINPAPMRPRSHRPATPSRQKPPAAPPLWPLPGSWRAPPAARGLRPLPIWVPRRTRRWRWPMARKAAVCCAPNSCSSKAPPRPMRTSRPRNIRRLPMRCRAAR
jgi:phosphoenolpyruvate-protein kinase (PTS system EI component)